MKIQFLNDKYADDIVVTVSAKEYDVKVEKIINLLGKMNQGEEKLVVEKEEKIYLLKEDEIYSFFSQDGRIYAKTKEDTFITRERLYEIEERLEGKFIRISKSVLVNKNYIRSLEMEFNGKMILYLDNGEAEYTSRSYLKKIKQSLGL
ncbi:LytTR family DNA-binding domain-containing protein [Filifactor villosus]|uniref:LytTR family DNA-binding domain-containing protein n=1 Tax=Filifactor villosus TaxID=29374 RepID=A0ABV9QN55_9FIRM